MARLQDHLRQGHQNELLSERLKDCGDSHSRGWSVVAKFYSLIQYVQAELKRANIPVRQKDSHGKRISAIVDAEIGDDPDTISDSYQDLKQLTEEVRYDCRLIGSTRVDEVQTILEEVKRNLEIDRSLETLEEYDIG